MSRVHKPGTVELTGTGKAFFVNANGDHVPFDTQRHRDARPWTRDRQRRDTREQTL